MTVLKFSPENPQPKLKPYNQAELERLLAGIRKFPYIYNDLKDMVFDLINEPVSDEQAFVTKKALVDRLIALATYSLNSTEKQLNDQFLNWYKLHKDNFENLSLRALEKAFTDLFQGYWNVAKKISWQEQDQARRILGLPSQEQEEKKFLAQMEKEIKDREAFALEYNLLSTAQYLNQGNNGVIFLLQLEKLKGKDGKIYEQLLKKGIITTEEHQRLLDPKKHPDFLVSKILKIGDSTGLRQEFENQDIAHELMRAHNSPVVAVPRPRYFASLESTPATKNFLELKGLNLGDRPINFFIMDLVVGQDLERLCLEKILQIGQKHSQANLQQLTVSQLMHEVNLFRGIPENKGKKAGIKKTSQELLSEKLISFLEENNIKFNATLADEIRLAIDYWHKHGFIWRDGHLRNIMISGSPWEEKSADKEQPRAFLVDYGGSVYEPGQSFPNFQEETLEHLQPSPESKGMIISDYHFLRIIKPLL